MSKPKLGRFKPIIDEILKADETAPRKQRHTAARIFRRLVEEHQYKGGYDQVRRYIGGRRRSNQETFIPLVHSPGQRMEADFGHIYVDFPDGRRQVAVLLLTWAYSYACFTIALPSERTEAILHGMAEGFAFFGCVPKEVWWDNPTTVAVQILTGRERKINERYQALASHYNFEPLFCMPARGNEKPHVENRVKTLQRRWATPVPRMQNEAELNAYLRKCCLEDRQRTVSVQIDTIGQRFIEEQAAALPLPRRAFEACTTQAVKVDKYQTVRFDSNRYTVPCQYAFTTVTIKGYVDHVEIIAEGRLIARHVRCYGRGEQILDPLHYLAILGRKPACLDHAAVYRQWRLPAAFTTLRTALEERHGPLAGARQYVRVLQLLAEHPQQRVMQAIELCHGPELLNADWIIRQTEGLRQRRNELASPQACSEHKAFCELQVPLPDLTRFDQLLSLEGQEHASSIRSAVAAENESQTTSLADHGCGV